MFYLRFVAHDGTEVNVACESYRVEPREGWRFVTTEHVIHPGNNYERNFCVGYPGKDHTFFHMMFVMSHTGKTIDKIAESAEMAA